MLGKSFIADQTLNELESDARRTIRLCYASRVFIGAPLFAAPTIFVFWTSFGLSPADIGLLEFSYALMVGLLEIPSGLAADRLGRRWTLIFAAACWIAGNTLYLWGGSFGRFVLCEACAALGVSMISGTDQAIVFESLKSLNREADFSRVWGRCRMIELLCGATYAIIGGHLAAVWIRAPFVAAVVFFLLYLLLVILMHEPRVSAVKASDNVRSLSEMIKVLLSLRAAFWLVALGGLLLSFAPIVNVFGQARLRESGFPLQNLGYVAAAGAVLSAATSAATHKIERQLKSFWTLIVIVTVVGISFSGLALSNGMGIVFFLLMFRCNDVFASTVLSSYLNPAIPTAVRVSVLSGMSLLGRLCSAGSNGVFAIMLTYGSVASALFAFAPLATIATGALVWASQRYRTSTPILSFQTKEMDN